MKIAERIILVLLLFVILAGGFWIYFAVQYNEQQERDAIARGDYRIYDEEHVLSEDDWREIYPVTVSAQIGSTSVQASIADSLSERIQGLSNTPFLPDNVVKLFAFDTAGSHSIWMKDMNYALDIMWVAEDGSIVHIEEHVAPETFPESFSSPTPAWYVVEANAGFVGKNHIEPGDQLVVLE